MAPRSYIQRVSDAAAAGMTLVLAFWSSGDLEWFEGNVCNGGNTGACMRAHPTVRDFALLDATQSVAKESTDSAEVPIEKAAAGAAPVVSEQAQPASGIVSGVFGAGAKEMTPAEAAAMVAAYMRKHQGEGPRHIWTPVHASI